MFLGKLLELPGGDRPMVVFCATESDVAQKARALSAGASGHITRPLDKDIIAAKFREAGLLTFPVSPGLVVVDDPDPGDGS